MFYNSNTNCYKTIFSNFIKREKLKYKIYEVNVAENLFNFEKFYLLWSSGVKYLCEKVRKIFEWV